MKPKHSWPLGHAEVKVTWRGRTGMTRGMQIFALKHAARQLKKSTLRDDLQSEDTLTIEFEMKGI